MFWLGLDIGTGGSRALLVDSKGSVRHSYTASHEEMQMLRPLWAEQHPDDWWRASRLAIRGVLEAAGINGSSVAGIGLSGQMHGLVLLDEANTVLRAALIWCDQRSQPQVDFINSKLGADKVLRSTANPVLTGFTLPKLLWVRDHEPSKFEAIRHVLLPKDYVRFKLIGEFATDVSDASGTALFDVAQRQWSEDMVSSLGLNPAILPKAYESSEVSGTVSKQASEATGLAPGTPVVAGAGDQAASAIGNGIVEPGTVSCTIGTSGVVFAYSEKPAYDPAGRVHTFCHAIPGAWHVMGVTQGAGLSFQWFRNRFAPDSGYDELTAEAALSPAGADGLFWMPYLMGERTPHLDANARGAWVGLTAKHQRRDLTRAILEGVCYSQKDGLEIIAALGAHPSLIRLSGGGAKSELWHQLFADIFNCPVATLESQEGSAYGAALLAMVGTGEYASAVDVCRAAIKEVSLKKPQRQAAEFYSKRYEIYRSLYPALTPAFQAIAELGDA
ncbi:MAG: xylulokinase [Acidobacteriaceae bacterium]|nr:xylulokinase [Acidobacteriaceae bacterium]MBV9767031.1 xylulokinase [Acidobacteriaceae bacterium]